jgi:hypothetical protein
VATPPAAHSLTSVDSGACYDHPVSITFVVRAAEIDERERASLAAETASHRTLADVVRWGLAFNPPRMVCDVIKQDEFTQDVIVPHRGGRYLVYDTS